MISGGTENIPIFFLTFYLTILPIVVTVVIRTRTDTNSIANILAHDASIHMFKVSTDAKIRNRYNQVPHLAFQ